ncbi:MAG TPA: tail fiber protein [Pyrinomonadaceae bacterium]|nr:tail fiber protein [Pyrinomonadaceae bacterium]
MSETLLSYAIYTTPNPLQASPKTGDAPPAMLQIVVSNPKGHLVNCKSIRFSFLKGTNARDFFADSTGIETSAPTGWKLTQSGSIFTAKPVTAKDGDIGPASLTFIISNIPVNTEPGTTHLSITEETASHLGTLDYALAKFPEQFKVSNFTAEPQVINPGDSTTLSWSGTSGATYTLEYLDKDDNTVTITHVRGDPDQPLPSTGSYTVEDIERDTTFFYLIVTMVVPGQDQPIKAMRVFPVIAKPLPPVIEYFRPRGYTASDCVIYSDEFLLEWKIDNYINFQLTMRDSEGTHVIDIPWSETSKKIFQIENETEYVMTIESKTGKQQQSSVNVTLVPAGVVGTVVAFVGPAEKVPAGWLICNGAEASGKAYPKLAALLGTTYGTPKTTGNVMLPDLRGMFLRGVDPDGVGDPDNHARMSPIPGNRTQVGPVVGSRQIHQLLNHTHHWDKNFELIGSSGADIAVQLALNSAINSNAGTEPTTNNDGGGAETRPVNVYVYYLIYAGTPQD